jgi:N-acyl-D-aspartate/D-glutamate deacylase
MLVSLLLEDRAEEIHDEPRGHPARGLEHLVLGIDFDELVAHDLSSKTAAKIIDADGLVVSPGFIDTHTHADGDLGKPGSNANLNYLNQGVTTVVTGNCGDGTFEIAKTKSDWEGRGIGTNAVHLVGYGDVRRAVLGTEPGEATPEELGKIWSILRQAMNEGAWGMSTGLEYIPDRYATTEEIIDAAKVVAESGGVYASHQRDEFLRVPEATRETIRIAEEQGREPFDVAADLVLEEPNLYVACGVMSEDDMLHAMKADWLMFSSDGDAFPIAKETDDPVVSHPRAFGSQARVLRKFVREDKVLTLEDAVRKLTSLPAEFLQLKNRGLLAEGYKADIVVFDPETVQDVATHADARQYSTGTEAVILAGKIVIEEGDYNGALNGRLLLLTEN